MRLFPCRLHVLGMRVAILTIALLLAVLLFPSDHVTASEGTHVEYIGGTVPSMRSKVGGKIVISGGDYFQFQGGKTELKIGYEKINLIEYGQKVDRRYAMALLISPMFLLTKSRQHFLTIGYTDEENRQQAMVFRVGKGEIRMVLVSLEARTGLKVQYQDSEAMKARKG